MKKIQTILVLAIVFCSTSISFGQCADTANIYTFTYNSATYEVVRENKTWVLAAACAVERGGILAEIDDLAEQNAIYSEVLSNASITASNTVAPDGGGASYLWIGGNDMAYESDWLWDGNNDLYVTHFWLGNASGGPISGRYNNWGNEPDNYGPGQDGLGLAITNWPQGVSGQWNDLIIGNTLYYVIEYPSTADLESEESSTRLILSPNPSLAEITLESDLEITSLIMYDSRGAKTEIDQNASSNKLTIDISALTSGIYYLKVSFANGESETRKIVR
jgi:hypothetical protein